jgi:hypothetical protein
MSLTGGDEVLDGGLDLRRRVVPLKGVSGLRAASLSEAVNRSRLAPVTSTHWLESSVATGVDSVGVASLEVAAAHVDDLPGLLPLRVRCTRRQLPSIC